MIKNINLPLLIVGVNFVLSLFVSAHAHEVGAGASGEIPDPLNSRATSVAISNALTRVRQAGDTSNSDQLSGANAVIQQTYYWRGTSVLKVCFSPRSNEQIAKNVDIRPRIQEVASRWTKETAIKFEWGPSPGKFYDCDNEATKLDYQVRVNIRFATDEVFDAAIGRDGMAQIYAHNSKDFYTVLLLFSLMSDKYKDKFEYLVLHEFGHVLGFNHEFQKAACQGVFSESAMEDKFHLTPANYDINFSTILPDTNAFYLDGEQFDGSSVMVYDLPASVYASTSDPRCRVTKVNNTLSTNDKIGVLRAYQYQDELEQDRVAVLSQIKSSGDLAAGARALVDTNLASPDVPDGSGALAPGVRQAAMQIPDKLRDSVVTALNELTGSYVVARIYDVDDALWIKADDRVIAQNQLSWASVRIPLKIGSNKIEFDVFNRRSYTGGINLPPLLNGHQPEGWHYKVALVTSDGKEVVVFNDGEDRPPEESVRFGGVFPVAIVNMDVKDDGSISLSSENSSIWR